MDKPVINFNTEPGDTCGVALPVVCVRVRERERESESKRERERGGGGGWIAGLNKIFQE